MRSEQQDCNVSLDEGWRRRLRRDLPRYVSEEKCYNRWGYAALDHRCRDLFKSVGELRGKNMLEIGGGQGLLSIWAVAQGAKRVILLEPESEGSTAGVVGRFHQHRNILGIPVENLLLVREELQVFDWDKGYFDVVFSVNSINHLDERACMGLSYSKIARASYLELFEKVKKLLCRGGWLIISDCGGTNYWRSLGLKNPFSPSVEWEKHQDPDVWKNILEEAGFRQYKLRWHMFYPLRFLGHAAANKSTARWLTSQFVITVQKKQDY